MAIQTGYFGPLHQELTLTTLKMCGMLVFKKNIIWNVFIVMIFTNK